MRSDYERSRAHKARLARPFTKMETKLLNIIKENGPCNLEFLIGRLYGTPFDEVQRFSYEKRVGTHIALLKGKGVSIVVKKIMTTYAIKESTDDQSS